MENQNDIDIINNYLSRNLAEAEKQAFENRLQTDAELRNSLEIQRAIRDKFQTVYEDEERQKIKERLKKRREFANAPEKKERDSPFIKVEVTKWYQQSWAKAAIVVLTLGAGIGWYLMNNSQNDVTAMNIKIEYSSESQGIAEPLKQIEAKIITDKKHEKHYQFVDTLKIFLPSVPKESIKLVKKDAENYELSIGNNKYQIKNTEVIEPLK